ncbi:MAG: sugar phosphate nucleotidyltransferase [Pseudomonadales bacterium]
MPAAGHARRLGEIERSKELLSINFPAGEQPVCANLLRQFHRADADQACIVLRYTKTDIPTTLGSGKQYGVGLQYIFVEHSPSVPHSVNAAYGETKDKEVLFGFPDILIKPADALQTLAAKRSAANSDVMLGLFPATQPEKVDMVDYDSHGRLRAIVIKDSACTLRETWLLAVWNARFTDWLQHWVEDRNTDSAEEPQLGRAFCAAITQGLQVDTYLFPNGEYLDIGTPDDLAVAQQKIWGL